VRAFRNLISILQSETVALRKLIRASCLTKITPGNNKKKPGSCALFEKQQIKIKQLFLIYSIPYFCQHKSLAVYFIISPHFWAKASKLISVLPSIPSEISYPLIYYKNSISITGIVRKAMVSHRLIWSFALIFTHALLEGNPVPLFFLFL